MTTKLKQGTVIRADGELLRAIDDYAAAIEKQTGVRVTRTAAAEALAAARTAQREGATMTTEDLQGQVARSAAVERELREQIGKLREELAEAKHRLAEIEDIDICRLQLPEPASSGQEEYEARRSLSRPMPTPPPGEQGTCANFWHPGHGREPHSRREAAGDPAEVHKDFVHDSGCLNWTPALPHGEQGKGGGEGQKCGACGGSGAFYETHDVGVTERIGCEECNATGYLAPTQPAEHPAKEK